MKTPHRPRSSKLRGLDLAFPLSNGSKLHNITAGKVSVFIYSRSDQDLLTRERGVYCSGTVMEADHVRACVKLKDER